MENVVGDTGKKVSQLNSGPTMRLPLLHYTKSEKRYKKCPKTGTRTITSKDRPIKYASHRDACILSLYASTLNNLLDAHYDATGLSDSVLAYAGLSGLWCRPSDLFSDQGRTCLH
jgi:hypothetical protein